MHPLHVFFLRYCLIPISVPLLTRIDGDVVLHHRYILIFGIRVAGWTVMPAK